MRHSGVTNACLLHLSKQTIPKDANDKTGPSESVATLDRGPRLEDHVTLSELGRIDEAF
jgi:hypothetical protein